MTAIDRMQAPADERSGPAGNAGPGWLGSWWVVGGFALLMLLALGWKFLADPSLSAPTRDPAWYTWRAQVILQGDPVRVVQEWGPNGLFAGGYRVTVPLAGALLQQVVGIDRYTFSAYLMIGLPILTGLALGAAWFRSRRDPLVVLTTLLATVALFLTTPYVGYLDNITVLFLLALMIPFVHEARTSWGARTALFLIGIAAAFTHPTTCVIFGVVLMAVFGLHFLTSRFSLGAALRADGPMLMSAGFGMIAGLACWVVGIWGKAASLAEAALPPPYTARFFTDRLIEWVGSLQPLVIVPFVAVAIVSTILLSRRTREPARTEDQVSIWWLLALAGAASVLTGAALPYYRFMNASAAPMALVGLGAFVAIRWLLRDRRGPALVAGAIGVVLVVASLGFVLFDGIQNRWVSESNQWANQRVRTSLAAVHEVVQAAGERPNVLVVNHGDTDDPATGTNTAYGWAKTYTNVFRTGLPGDAIERSVTYLGTLDGFLAGERTTSTAGSDGYTDAATAHWCEAFGGPAGVCDPDGALPEDFRPRFEEFGEPPVVFLIGQFYGGLCNGVEDCSAEMQQQTLDATTSRGVEVGPDVFVIEGDGLYSPPPEVVERAQQAAAEEATKFRAHPGALENLPQNLLVVALLSLLLIVPGWLASSWLGIRTTIDRIALIPGMSVVIVLLAGIAVLAVWRGPLTTAKGWTVVAVALAVGAALRVAEAWLRRPLESLGSFFNSMFSVFSNRDFSVLVGVQFLAQAGQGVVQGAIAKSLAFGGQEGFDVQNLPSADYLLTVVLALYVPYTLISPFIGVFIDRFPRRRVVWWADVATAVVVTVVALAVLVPLGADTTEGKTFATGALIVGLLAVQACVRVALTVKSASMPDVLSGKDLLQGNGLSQAGGALAQIFGIVLGGGLAGFVPPFVPVIVGALVLLVGAFVAMQLRRAELHPHETSFGQEASMVVRNIVDGIKEVAGRAPAALGLSSFQMLRYQFWGFGLFVFALYAKNLVAGGDSDTLALVLSGLGGLVGGGLGMVVAQKYKDRIAPVRLLLGSMVLLGTGAIVGGAFVSVGGFAAMLFLGFFSFFVGKISADTIMQQTMPDDFRGRAFALFDIAYNLGYIVPAIILFLIWTEGSEATTRTILLVSGVVFLGLTALVVAWARRIRDQFAPQDDLIEIDGEIVLPAQVDADVD
ncbi:MAG TPA: MFS transporter [Actinomycetota bacterium]|nr:MFS transporter [Actinomycetota bacterium]